MKWHTGMVLGILLLGAVWADAGPTGGYPQTLKVLSARSEAIPLNTGFNDVPKDCNLMDFSAYCNDSRTVKVRNTMLVQDSRGKSFALSCTIDSRWSNCVSLPVGETLGAQSEKNGFTVWYRNAKGKEVRQSYALVSLAGKPDAVPAFQPNSSMTDLGNSSPAPADAAVPEDARYAVKCNFTSSPAGAEIALDGKYVGNTPSTIAVSAGPHAVTLSMSGFATWERTLTVSPGSDVGVTATLQKSR
jgi:hypothetical protein